MSRLRAVLLSLAIVLAAVAPAAAGATPGPLAAPAAAHRRTRTVIVPHVRGDVVTVYARLHRAGLRVTILRAFVLRTDALPFVSGVRPRPGTRVGRGTAVRLTLRCCRRAAAPVRPPAPTRVVPLSGGTLAWALDWVQASGLTARVRLGGLRDGQAHSLAGNYFVSSQQPRAGVTLTAHQTPILHARQGPAARCAAPWREQVVARNAAAVVTATSFNGPYTVDDDTRIVYRACLRATGKTHVLTQTIAGKYGGDALFQIELAGRYLVATRFSNAGSGPPSALLRYEVTTGRGGVIARLGSTLPDHVSLSAGGLVAWHMTTPGVAHFSLSGVSCPSAGFCVAVDGSGGILTSTNPSGGRSAWSRTTLTGQELRAVACPTSSLCVVVASSGLWWSSDPAGGAPAFSPVPIPSSSLTSIACSGTDLCVAVGGNEISSSSNPGGGASTWVTGRISAQGLIAVSCPSASLCVAGDDAGSKIFSSTAPGSGYVSWTGVPVDPGGEIAAVACPSTTLCVAPDRSSGSVFSSSNPAGPDTSWSASPTIGLSFSSALSCPSTSVCVAGGTGTAVTTDPAALPMHWSQTSSQPTVIQSLACPSTRMCVATDGTGDISTTTDPTGPSWPQSAVDVPDCATAAGCATEAVSAAPLNGGPRQIAAAGPGSGTEIMALKVSGQTVSWTQDGQSRSEVVP